MRHTRESNKPSGSVADYTWTYNGHALPVVSEFVYLGILFPESGSFSGCNVAFKKQTEKAEACLHGMFRRCSALHIHHVDTLGHLYDVLVRSVQDYGCEVPAERWTGGI